ncbi:MAG: hypothetical protein Q9179_000055 [Wetmoreana sp. 5 TL-2023]
MPASDVDGLLKSLRQDKLPVLLENNLKAENDAISAEKCRKDLWTCGMQPTMIPIAISAILGSISQMSKKSLSMTNSRAQSFLVDLVDQTNDTCDACCETDTEYKEESQFLPGGHLEA